MTAPSEEQVREVFEHLARNAEENAESLRSDARAETYGHAASIFRAAIALLDAGREDRERVDWIEQEIETGDITISGSAHGVTLDLGEGVPKSRERTVRAAIDQARGA